MQAFMHARESDRCIVIKRESKRGFPWYGAYAIAPAF